MQGSDEAAYEILMRTAQASFASYRRDLTTVLFVACSVVAPLQFATFSAWRIFAAIAQRIIRPCAIALAVRHVGIGPGQVRIRIKVRFDDWFTLHRTLELLVQCLAAPPPVPCPAATWFFLRLAVFLLNCNIPAIFTGQAVKTKARANAIEMHACLGQNRRLGCQHRLL